MDFLYDVPREFWGLFRSVNRDIYIEALLLIDEEYEYSNYFLSKESCIQALSVLSSEQGVLFWEEEEQEEEKGLSMPRKVLNRLLRMGWLRKLDDYQTFTSHIMIPDYAAFFIDAFRSLTQEPEEDTQIYIQNAYATLSASRTESGDRKIAMLKTALVNTKKLNKTIRDMLLNMDKFFGRLLEQKSFAALLKEHLEGYVQEAATRKYHILKTSDNFYRYKADIKQCINRLREESVQEQEVFYLDQIERGFDDIERRMVNMDKEHSKYIRSTLNRLNYLLSDESDRKGMLIKLLNHLGEAEDEELGKYLERVAEAANLASYDVLHDTPLYRRKSRRKFEELVEPAAVQEELSREDVLKMNKLTHRYSGEEIRQFLEDHMENGICDTAKFGLKNGEEYEKLVLAYDISTRKNSPYQVIFSGKTHEDGAFSYPEMIFVKKERKES